MLSNRSLQGEVVKLRFKQCKQIPKVGSHHKISEAYSEIKAEPVDSFLLFGLADMEIILVG